MSKEIIIDGVDVSGCEQIFGDNKCALLDQYFCENNLDCYYKQLKRLQAENEELKKALEEIREIAENYFEECGVPDDYFKRNNYSWKQHQIKGLTCKLQQIFDKSNEVLK